MQADGRFYVNDHLPLNDTFLLRRVRPIIEGTLFKYYDYRIMLDFGANTSGTSANTGNNGMLQDAYLNVHYWPEFQIQIGKFKPPVGLERLQSGANLTLPSEPSNSARSQSGRQASSFTVRFLAAS